MCIVSPWGSADLKNLRATGLERYHLTKLLGQYPRSVLPQAQGQLYPQNFLF
jgi:hypothetical protein